MSTVVDASLVVAALVDDGDPGRWALDTLGGSHLVSPQLMPVEVTNALLRSVAAGRITDEMATLAQAELLDLDVEHLPFAPFADRVWELRANVTAYDAWYVAIAEALDLPLATVDHRLAGAPGPRCEFVLPP